MASWWQALTRTRQSLSDKLSKVFTGSRQLDPAELEELEESLLAADIPAAIAADLIECLTDSRRDSKSSTEEQLKALLLDELGDTEPLSFDNVRPPVVFLVTGVNGSGKTTTCAKLAYMVMKQGKKPLMVAADTFRAAGTDQLNIWAGRVGCDIVSGKPGSDAAAVAHDGLNAALSRNADVVIVDTAGRMHTKQPLMNELTKMSRVMGKCIPGAPHENWIVLDAALGRNAISQAGQFHENVPLTGAVISKLDGTAKAGFIFSIYRELQIPVRFAGIGEGMEDMAPFEPESFVNAMLGLDSFSESRI